MRRLAAAVLLALLAWPCGATAAPRRLALVVGANRGAAGRIPLRYALDDARRFAGLMQTIGGVAPGDAQQLQDPTRRAFLDALDGLRERAATAPPGGRTEVVVYFSGHADERGLMLGPEILTYRELREAITAVHPDVGITILDACASGAITRLKGGQASAGFLGAELSQVRGYAFLTSSSENEAAQEAEHLRGSFFTHALLTGLRGAADASGDGRVTLGEAYQFAFAETLAQTASTQGGAQHPAYDIDLAGTGDVVVTDVRDTSASVSLGPEYAGRFLVVDASRRPVAELDKAAGRRVELALEPGRYEVYFEQERSLLTAALRLERGQRHELAREDLKPAARVPTALRGNGSVAGDALAGRQRIVVQLGLTHTDVTTSSDATRVASANGGMQFSRWVRDDLALDLRIHAIDLGWSTGSGGSAGGADLGFLAGARYHPPVPGALRPHLGGSVGVFTQTGSVSSTGTSVTHVAGPRLGGTLEAGLDWRMGGHFLLNVDGVLAMRDERASRFDLLVGLGVVFGSGSR